MSRARWLAMAGAGAVAATQRASFARVAQSSPWPCVARVSERRRSSLDYVAKPAGPGRESKSIMCKLFASLLAPAEIRFEKGALSAIPTALAVAI